MSSVIKCFCFQALHDNCLKLLFQHLKIIMQIWQEKKHLFLDYWKDRNLVKEYYNNKNWTNKIACIFLQVHFIKCSKGQGSHNGGKFGEASEYENRKVAFSNDAIKQAGGIVGAFENEMRVEVIVALWKREALEANEWFLHHFSSFETCNVPDMAYFVSLCPQMKSVWSINSVEPQYSQIWARNKTLFL